VAAQRERERLKEREGGGSRAEQSSASACTRRRRRPRRRRYLCQLSFPASSRCRRPSWPCCPLRSVLRRCGGPPTSLHSGAPPLPRPPLLLPARTWVAPARRPPWPPGARGGGSRHRHAGAARRARGRSADGGGLSRGPDTRPSPIFCSSRGGGRRCRPGPGGARLARRCRRGGQPGGARGGDWHRRAGGPS